MSDYDYLAYNQSAYFEYLTKENLLEPKLRDITKSIWNKAHSIFCDKYKNEHITNLICDVIICLSIEKEGTGSLFDIIGIADAKGKNNFIKRYYENNGKRFDYILNPNTLFPHKYHPHFLLSNNRFEIILQSKEFSELLAFLKETIANNPALNLLRRELYNSKPIILAPSPSYDKRFSIPTIIDYLCEYETTKACKTAVKHYGDHKAQWLLKPDNSWFWEEDIVLNDMFYVWSSCERFSRFIDKDARWGFIDVEANKRYYMPDYVDELKDCRCGRAVFLDKRSGLYGYISPEGRVIIEPKYEIATDFIRTNESCIAAVVLSIEEKDKYMKFDASVEDEFDFSNYMYITVLDGFITIDIEGNFTPDIQQKYKEEVEKEAKEREKHAKEIENDHETGEDLNCTFRVIPDKVYYETEDDIMSALEGGYGDLFGL